MRQRYQNISTLIVCIIFTMTVLSGIGTFPGTDVYAWKDHNGSISGSQSLFVPLSTTTSVNIFVFFPSHPFVMPGSGHSDVFTGNNQIITKTGFYRQLDLCILNLVFRN